MKRLVLFAAIAASSVSIAASRYEYRRVISVQPLVQQQCYETNRHVYGSPRYNEPRSRTAPVVGAIVGGALGNQIGDGDGRRAATVAGAVLGYSMTRDAQERNRYQGREYVETVPACEHVTTGYSVVYQGGDRPVILPYNPGRNVRVRIDEYVEDEIR